MCYLLSFADFVRSGVSVFPTGLTPRVMPCCIVRILEECRGTISVPFFQSLGNIEILLNYSVNYSATAQLSRSYDKM